MLPEIVTVNKSVSCRLEDYQELLDDTDTPSSDMHEMWASIFQDLSIIGVDWRALWILNEECCEKYSLLYPTAVIVNVNSFNWQELTANVTVLAVQEDIVIPSDLDVPVVDLHPLKNQHYGEPELRNIEDWLDKCRYFMKNLWYPWDGKLNVSIKDWCRKHLENRLLMQSDMRNGVFDVTIVNYVKSLLLEAQNFNSLVEKRYPEYEDENVTKVKQLIRMKMLKTELNLFENPGFRKGMILLKSKDKERKKISRASMSQKKEGKLVWPGGNIDSLLECLNQARRHLVDDVRVNVYKSLQEAVDSASGNDIIFLTPGLHVLTKFSGIDVGGFIKGFSETETVIVPDTSTAPRAILLNCFGDVQLENLSIRKPSGIVIQVFGGTVRLFNCRLISMNNSTSRGIVVVAGSQLYLDNCELRGFGTGLALQKGTKAYLTNTKITDCIEGIKMGDDTTLTMDSVEISYCSTYAIRMESSQMNSADPVVGGLDIVEKKAICDIKSVTFANNKKGNVLLKGLDKVLEPFDNGDDSCDVIFIDDTDYESSEVGEESVDESETNVPDEDMDEVRVTFQKSL